MKDSNKTKAQLISELEALRKRASELEILVASFDDSHQSRMVKRLESLNAALLAFGYEPEVNIRRLVHVCGETLGGACVLYNRLEHDMLTSVSGWQIPEGFKRTDQASGHLCTDVIGGNDDNPLVVHDLQQSPYAQTDPNVKQYGLETYVGMAVRAGGQAVGSLCVVYTSHHDVRRDDEWLLHVVAAAIGSEEQRQSMINSLRQGEGAMRAVFDASADQIVLTDAKGVILAANVRAAMSVGAFPKDLIGKNIEACLPAGPEGVRARLVRAVVTSGEPAYASEQHGDNFYEHSVYPVLDDDGSVGRLALYSQDITDSKRAELLLKESEGRFRDVFEQSAVGMSQCDAQGRYLMVNDKLCDMLGYSRNELLSFRFQDITHPDDQHANLLQHGRLVSHKVASYSIEKRYVCKDGSILWVNLTVSANRDAQGRDKYFSAVAEDISWRKRMENTLLRRDAVLEAVSNAAEVFLATTQWEDEIAGVLENFGTAAGASRAYLFENYKSEDGTARTRQKFLWSAPGVSSGGEPFEEISYEGVGHVEIFKALSSKRVFCCCVSELPQAAQRLMRQRETQSLALVPIFTQDQWWGFIGFDDCQSPRKWMSAEIEALVAAADIIGNAIGRRKTEQALVESERRFRMIAEAVEDVFWISTPDRSRLLYASPSFERYLGPREPVYQAVAPYYDAAHPDDRSRLLRATREAGNKALEIEYRLKCLDQKYHWVRERSYPVCDDDGNVQWLAGISTDVTQQKNSDQRVRQSLREKELLLQEVHHRVKNNLQVISSLLDMAGRKIMDPQAKEIVLDTQSKIHSMAMIHLQLYGCERFDSIDISNYAKLLAWQLAQMYNAANVSLQFDLHETFLPIGKAIPCGLILSEMISNVFKHAFPNDQPGVLDLRVGTGDNGNVSLVVADNGVGMPTSCHEEEFSSVGLKLLKNIVLFQLGGEVSIQSGDGTEITVIFHLDDEGDK